MSKTPSFRLKCEAVTYRQGFIELTPSIHDGCVNIEVWDVDPEKSLDGVSWVDDPSLDEASITANCEIEMTLDQARGLAEAILSGLEST